MARLESFDKGTQNVQIHPSTVRCYHQVVTSADGTRYLHVSTFGSSERMSQPKSSQSLQLDEVRAAELIEIIREAFPRLAREGTPRS